MRSLFISLVLIVSLFFSTNLFLVKAQGTDPSETLNTFLNPNCGGINQACCSIDKIEIPEFKPNLPEPWDVIVSPFERLINSLSSKFSGMVTALVDFVGEIFEFDYKKGFCKEGAVPSDKSNPASCTCLDKKLEDISRLCLMVNAAEQPKCLSCVTGKKGIWTAIGCVESDISTLVRNTAMRWGIGLAGGLALLCIIYSAFMMQSSQGNPERLKKAQEMITSCIMGLMLIIFSVFILRLIGVEILKIPGFG